MLNEAFPVCFSISHSFQNIYKNNLVTLSTFISAKLKKDPLLTLLSFIIFEGNLAALSRKKLSTFFIKNPEQWLICGNGWDARRKNRVVTHPSMIENIFLNSCVCVSKRERNPTCRYFTLSWQITHIWGLKAFRAYEWSIILSVMNVFAVAAGLQVL